MAKVPVFIAGLIAAIFLAPLPLLARKDTSDSNVRLTSAGRRLETDYTRRMKALKSELNSSVSKIDKRRKAYYLKALEAYMAVEKNLNNTRDAEKMIAQAQLLSREAVEHLHDGKLFQGYPGTHLYESVDGVGYLFLALLYLETGKELDLRGFGF